MRITYITILMLMTALAYGQKSEPQKYADRMPQWNEPQKVSTVRIIQITRN